MIGIILILGTHFISKRFGQGRLVKEGFKGETAGNIQNRHLSHVVCVHAHGIGSSPESAGAVLNRSRQSPSDGRTGHLPKGFSTINYQLLLSNPLITGSILNSVWITVAGTFLNLPLTSMAAYVLARTDFIGKRLCCSF